METEDSPQSARGPSFYESGVVFRIDQIRDKVSSAVELTIGRAINQSDLCLLLYSIVEGRPLRKG